MIVVRQVERPVFALPFLLIAGMAGCCLDRAWTSADSWYRPLGEAEAAEMSKGNKWKHVDFERTHAVSDRRLPEAESSLAERAWTKLTGEEASSLVGRKLAQSDERAWYLLRAVILTTNGRFSVSTLDGCVRVHYGCLGAFPHGGLVVYENGPRLDLVDRGADVVRVHDVKEMVRVARMADAILR